MRKILLLLSCLLPAWCTAAQRIEVWTYHSSPPFVLDGRTGLSAAFVELLNEDPANGARFQFELLELPRKRLDLRLAENRPGVLLWVAPRFLDLQQSGRGHWSRALLEDQQDVVSRVSRPIDYLGPQSLHGLAFGGLLGHLYPGLDAEVARGRIRREDVATDLQNLEKLSSGRVDAALLPHSTLLYYRKTRQLDDLYVSPTALYAFRRHLLMTASLGDPATGYLRRFVEELPNNPRWHAVLERYGLQSLAIQAKGRVAGR